MSLSLPVNAICSIPFLFYAYRFYILYFSCVYSLTVFSIYFKHINIFKILRNGFEK